MSDEITIRNIMKINAGNVKYNTPQEAGNFQLDMEGRKGPTPGLIAVTTDGVDADLSLLDTPGVGEITNLSELEGNWIEYGPYDPDIERFYPVWKVGPGETWPLQFSPNMFGEFSSGGSTGTGTSGPSTNTLRFRARLQDCEAVLSAFEA
jgi:hypothetical protein